MSETTRRTQAQRRTDARERLLQAAAELIADEGLAALTLADVGDRAGYSRGIANHHFGTKAGLVAELIRQVETAFADAVAPALRLDRPVDALAETANVFLRQVEDGKPIHRAFLVLWTAAITDHDDLDEAMKRSDERFRAGIVAEVRRGQDAGDITTELDATDFAVLFVGLLRGVGLQALLTPATIDIAAARAGVDQLLRHVFRQ